MKQNVFLVVNTNYLLSTFPTTTATGIKCYVCNSEKGFEECASNNTLTCPTGLDRCYESTQIYGSFKSYSKGCQSTVLCDNKDTFLKVCEAVGGSTCKLDCCDSDLCNGGIKPMVSVLLMVACALLAFFR